MSEYESRREEGYRQSKLRRELWGIDWPGHPGFDLDKGIPLTVQDATDSLITEPTRWKLIAETNDPEACYSYSDLAFMIRDDGLHILVHTSGCSCPSPTETWGIVAEGKLSDMIACCEKENKSWGGEGHWHGPWKEMYEFLLEYSSWPEENWYARKAPGQS